jgi:hypothetical protein
LLGIVLPGFVECDIGIVGPNMHPTVMFSGRLISTDAEIRKSRLQELDHAVDVIDLQIGMLKSDCHGEPPFDAVYVRINWRQYSVTT